MVVICCCSVFVVCCLLVVVVGDVLCGCIALRTAQCATRESDMRVESYDLWRTHVSSGTLSFGSLSQITPF